MNNLKELEKLEKELVGHIKLFDVKTAIELLPHMAEGIAKTATELYEKTAEVSKKGGLPVGMLCYTENKVLPSTIKTEKIGLAILLVFESKVEEKTLVMVVDLNKENELWEIKGTISFAATVVAYNLKLKKENYIKVLELLLDKYSEIQGNDDILTLKLDTCPKIFQDLLKDRFSEKTVTVESNP